MIRSLAALGVLVTCRLALATPQCPAPLEAVASLVGPSRWQAIAPVPGTVTSAAGSGDTIFAAAIVDGTPKLLELANGRWQDVPNAPAATGVAVIGGHVYAFVKRDDRVEVSFARRGTTAWSPTTAPPEAATRPFACGDALCASISIEVRTLPDEVHTYAATPSSTGALGSWTHVLSRGLDGLIGTSTVAGSTGFLFTRDGTYANPIDPGGRYRAVWHRVGPPAPGAGPAAIAHDGWLFAAGGVVMDRVPDLGKCSPRRRNTRSNLVYAARIAADGSLGRWRAAAPLPRGGVVRLAASAQQAYAFTSPAPDRATADVVAIPWTELLASIEPACSGIESELAACEKVLATSSRVESDPPSRLMWSLLGIALVVVAAIAMRIWIKRR